MNVGIRKGSLLGLLIAVLVTLCVQSAPALAAKPWWSLHIDSSPAILQPGQAKDEVQEVTVSATGGSYLMMSEPITKVTHEFAWNATRQEMQEGLEEMFGAGNVEVLSGQGDATGSQPYKIVWKGEFTDHTIELHFYGQLTGGRKEVSTKEVVKGKSDATLLLTAANMGNADATGPVMISAKLPPGLIPLGLRGGGGVGDLTTLECSQVALACVYNGSTAPYDQVQMLISVNLAPGAKTGETVELTVGGGDSPATSTTQALTVGDVSAAFGIEKYEMTPEEEGGAVATQAGSHPFQLTTTTMLNEHAYDNRVEATYTPDSAGLAKDLTFKLPPGLVGNPTPFPQCTVAQFDQEFSFVNQCPNDTAIGVAAVTIALDKSYMITVPVPLFNLTPTTGEPARFGFEALGVPVFLDTSVRTGGDYGVTVSVSNITQAATFIGSRVTFWGTPGDPSHDGQRGWSCVDDGIWAGGTGVPCAPLGAHSPPPFLELPTSCQGAMSSTIEGDSWQEAGAFVSSGPSVPMPALDGCNQLPFSPSVSVSPDSEAGSTPSGLTVGIHVPQDVSLNSEGLGEADARDTKVTLPAGVALNPAAADGLLSCSEAQIALSVDVAPSCPEASKVATVEIKSPLLPNPLVGEAYLAAQGANPFGSLVALYLVAKDPVSGTLIKIAGEVKPDPVTGQLVSTFNNTPQLPFEDLKLHFFGGDRAPLGTPTECGAYTTTTRIAPWSGNAPSTPSSTFDIASGPNGGACDNPAPFSPSLTAGTTSIQAGGFSPFTMTVTRQDGQQDIGQLQLHMPPGLSGVLTGVELCGEAQANAGTCGAGSLIGETTVSVGLGGDPYSVTGGKVYVTGPYEGAPFGISVVVPAKAGPYDLGQVVVRGTIQVDPVTSALTVTTNSQAQGHAIPHILDGIPLQIKHVNFTTTRSGFTFNPTNCDPMSVTGNIGSLQGSSSPVSVPFQVTNCAVLKFKPDLKASTNGKTSRHAGASLQVNLTYPKGPLGSQANIRYVKVDLPKQLPSYLPTLQKACIESTFAKNPAECPAGSIVGTATASTPIIPVPLTGPAYFVSNGGAKWPELVIVLSGYGVIVQLHGETFISKGVTSSTFKYIPDVPVGSFQLKLPQGSNHALAANGNLCNTSLKMPTLFIAQNGMQIKQSTPITATGCTKHKPKHKHKKHKHRKRKTK